MKGLPGERLIFSRILGHAEILRSHRWQESSDCWICDHHRYTVIMVSKSIAENFFIRPGKMEKDILLNKIKCAEEKRQETFINNSDTLWGSEEEEIYFDAETEDQKKKVQYNNYICSSFHKWKGDPLLPLGLFMKKLKKNIEPTTTYIEIENSKYEQEMARVRQRKEEKKIQS